MVFQSSGSVLHVVPTVIRSAVRSQTTCIHQLYWSAMHIRVRGDVRNQCLSAVQPAQPPAPGAARYVQYRQYDGISGCKLSAGAAFIKGVANPSRAASLVCAACRMKMRARSLATEHPLVNVAAQSCYPRGMWPRWFRHRIISVSEPQSHRFPLLLISHPFIHPAAGLASSTVDHVVAFVLHP